MIGEVDLLELGDRASWGIAHESAGLVTQRHAVIVDRAPRFTIRFDADLRVGRPGWIHAGR